MTSSLWRDKSSNLFLAGSVNLLPASRPLPEAIVKVYEDAAMVALVARIDQARDWKLWDLPGKITLENVLDPDLLTAAKALAADLGADFEEMKRLRPWAFVFSLIGPLVKHFTGAQELGGEQEWFDRAIGDRKPLDFLEHVDFVPKRFNAEGLGLQIEFLRHFIADKERGKDWYLALIDGCQRGDLALLREVQEIHFGPFPRMREFLAVQRNRNWLARFHKYRQSKHPILAVVGCMHLVGENNLRELLEQKGADFEQL